MTPSSGAEGDAVRSYPAMRALTARSRRRRADRGRSGRDCTETPNPRNPRTKEILHSPSNIILFAKGLGSVPGKLHKENLWPPLEKNIGQLADFSIVTGYQILSLRIGVSGKFSSPIIATSRWDDFESSVAGSRKELPIISQLEYSPRCSLRWSTFTVRRSDV